MPRAFHPDKIVGAKAYDSDSHDQLLKAKGITLIAPHRSSRRVKTQDGRQLRLYKKTWVMERFFAG